MSEDGGHLGHGDDHPYENSPTGGDGMSYKDQRKHYKTIKKRRQQELDEEMTVKSGMLKFRNRLKNWHKFWIVLQSGKLIIYKENKSDWVGTVMLYGGFVQARPTKKAGFSFKFYGSGEGGIYTTKGHWFTYYMLPTESCIMRTSTEDEGKAWMAAIETSMVSAPGPDRRPSTSESLIGSSPVVKTLQFSNLPDGTPDITPQQIIQCEAVPETRFTPTARQIYCKPGVTAQRMTLESDTVRSLWQELEGTDSGSVVPYSRIPAALLSNRSALAALGDPFAYGTLLQAANNQSDPIMRILGVAKWTMALLTCKGDGARIPVCPVKGEVSRCCYEAPAGASEPVSNRTFVICEQVSAEPPVSAIYATNQEAGWIVHGHVSQSVELYGNSLEMAMNASIHISMLDSGGEYVLTLPSTALRGLVTGRIAKEMYGLATITGSDGYSVSLNFAINNHVEADGESANRVTGTVSKEEEVLGKLSGQWDTKVVYESAATGSMVVFENNISLRDQCAQRLSVMKDELHKLGSDAGFFDSEQVWDSIQRQRSSVGLRSCISSAHQTVSSSEPVFFSNTDGVWRYKYMDVRKWDPTNCFYVTSQDGRVTVLSKDDLQHAIKTVAAMPQDAVPNSPPIATPTGMLRNSRQSVKSRFSMKSSVTDFGDDEALEVFNEIREANAMLLKRVEILEGRQRLIYKWHIPLLIILYYVMQALVAKLANLIFE